MRTSAKGSLMTPKGPDSCQVLTHSSHFLLVAGYGVMSSQTMNRGQEVLRRPKRS
jgi:hypothetical protein